MFLACVKNLPATSMLCYPLWAEQIKDNMNGCPYHKQHLGK